MEIKYMNLEIFEILAETAKAWKLGKDGMSFWMPKSQIKKDGNFSKKGEEIFERAENEFSRKNGETDVTAAMVGETDKAIKLKIEVEFCDAETSGSLNFFCPKSLVKNGKLANWFFTKKIEELADELREKNRGSFLLIFNGKIVY